MNLNIHTYIYISLKTIISSRNLLFDILEERERAKERDQVFFSKIESAGVK